MIDAQEIIPGLEDIGLDLEGAIKWAYNQYKLRFFVEFDDAVQEARTHLAQAAQKAPVTAEHRKAYLFRALKSKFSNLRRNATNARRFAPEVNIEHLNIPVQDEYMRKRLLHLDLQFVLKATPLKLRERAIVMLALSGLTDAEIGRAMQISREWVRVIKNRAIRKLQRVAAVGADR